MLKNERNKGYLVLFSSLLVVVLVVASLAISPQKANQQYKCAAGATAEECRQDTANGIIARYTQAMAWAAVISALAVIGQVIITARQVGISKRQIGIMQEQATIAERSLTVDERPYLFIFNITNIKNIVDEWTEYPAVVATVANYGRTPAIIRDVRFFIDYDGGQDMPFTRLPAWNNILISPIIAPQEKREKVHFLADHLRQILNDGYEEEVGQYPDFWIPEQHANNWPLCLRIIFDYDGPFTRDHQASAYWRYDFAEGRFRIDTESQHNYTK